MLRLSDSILFRPALFHGLQANSPRFKHANHSRNSAWGLIVFYKNSPSHFPFPWHKRSLNSVDLKNHQGAHLLSLVPSLSKTLCTPASDIFSFGIFKALGMWSLDW